MLVYKENNYEIFLGNQISLSSINIDENSGLWRSEVGKVLKSGKADEIVLEAKQHNWLEVYFEVTLKKKGKILTNLMFWGEPYDERDNDPYTENSGYEFLRYILQKGAIIIK